MAAGSMKAGCRGGGEPGKAEDDLIGWSEELHGESRCNVHWSSGITLRGFLLTWTKAQPVGAVRCAMSLPRRAATIDAIVL